MKKTRGFSMLYIIPIIALLLAIGGVFFYKLYTEGAKVKATDVPVVKIVPPIVTETGKPSSGYGSIPVITPTPVSTFLPVGSSSVQIDLETLINEDPEDNSPDFSPIDASLIQL